MAESLPPLPAVQEVQRRLRLVFPEGVPYRDYCTRLTAARTVFVMLYVGAVESNAQYVRPNQVTRMSTAQAKRTTQTARRDWIKASLAPKASGFPGRWYADNTREPIRDETIRTGLIPNNAVVERSGLPTNSSKPKYALQRDFAALFDPRLVEPELSSEVRRWQSAHLSQTALARVTLLRSMAVAGGDHITITFPNGEARNLPPGPSSVIAKAVVEEFAPRFLGTPGVIYLADGRRRVVARNDEVAQAIGLTFPPDRLLPDLLLVDLAPTAPLLVFVEVVASDGPMNELRKSELAGAASRAGFLADQIAFVTAYSDRDHPAFKKTIGLIAWGTFAWFASEPTQVLIMRDQRISAQRALVDLLKG